MNHLPPLFAAGWGELVIVIIFFMISALGQLLSAKNKEGKPRPPRPQGDGAPPKGQEIAENLRGEVEDFLREMQGKPPRPKQKQKKPKPAVIKVQQPTPVAAPTSLRSESVREHVRRHISTVEIAQQTSKLGEDVGLADERLESHLQQTFEHKLGALEHQVRPAEPKHQNKRADDIAQLLRSPAGMRQAIIASEILRRPEI
ncbi:hypothetical protein [Bythopirellula polymerisocia]|uniref:Uncharacterized protein n=1 Tax=Bythopirellula polymerisocia TaxID=2528003 RepID=A0A5C6CCX2_9BACT|nr:hypothetical protein [Bythopirellula polymerisocia]TWU21895.1 hypothetical protein Pla144_43300 [Bythopirellula polymerisocia]